MGREKKVKHRRLRTEGRGEREEENRERGSLALRFMRIDFAVGDRGAYRLIIKILVKKMRQVKGIKDSSNKQAVDDEEYAWVE